MQHAMDQTDLEKEKEALETKARDLLETFANKRDDLEELHQKLPELYELWDALGKIADSAAKRKRSAFPSGIDENLIRQHACYCDLRGE